MSDRSTRASFLPSLTKGGAGAAQTLLADGILAISVGTLLARGYIALALGCLAVAAILWILCRFQFPKRLLHTTAEGQQYQGREFLVRSRKARRILYRSATTTVALTAGVVVSGAVAEKVEIEQSAQETQERVKEGNEISKSILDVVERRETERLIKLPEIEWQWERVKALWGPDISSERADVQAALDRIAELDPSDLWAALLRSKLAYRNGNIEESADLLDQTLGLIPSGSEEADFEMLGALQLLRASICVLQSSEDCEPLILAALDSFRNTEDLNSAGQARFLLAATLFRKGDLDRAYAEAQAALRLHSEADVPAWIKKDCGLLAWMALIQDPEQAVSYARQAQEAAKRTEERYEELDSGLLLVDILLSKGRAEEADQTLAEIASRIDDLASPELVAERNALAAQVASLSGSPGEAVFLHERAAAAFLEAAEPLKAAMHIDQAWSIWEEGREYSKAAEVLRRYLPQLSSVPDHGSVEYALRRICAGLNPDVASELFASFSESFAQQRRESCVVGLKLALADVYLGHQALDRARREVVQALQQGSAAGCFSMNAQLEPDCWSCAAMYPLSDQVKPLGEALEEASSLDATIAFYEASFEALGEEVDWRRRLFMSRLLCDAYGALGAPLQVVEVLRRSEPAYRSGAALDSWRYELDAVDYEAKDRVLVLEARCEAFLGADLISCAARDTLELANALYLTERREEALSAALRAMELSCARAQPDIPLGGCVDPYLGMRLVEEVDTWSITDRLTVYRQAIASSEDCLDTDTVPVLYEGLFRAHQDSDDLSACLKLVPQAATAFRSAGRLDSLTTTLSWWGQAAQEVGDQELALEFHRRGLFLAEETKNEVLIRFHAARIEYLETR